MKVIYESYLRRHRNGGNNNNNNGINIEICHPTDLPKSSTAAMDPDQLPQRSPIAHIISADSLVINKELGVGEFGVVQQGVWTNGKGQRIQVAIKCLSEARLENNRQEFLKEAAMMHAISNENIVTLYGVVLEPSVMLVTELAPLRSLLECLKEPQLSSHFPVTSLCTFASQIADGMAYLESKRLIHRDLAARNILVFAKNRVKVSDFGLSRALGVGKDYYQSNFNVNLKLPIAWCAPECINYLKFTSQSDIWAYGVTLWEMFSFGFQPWAALTGQQILEAIDKPNYQRLEQPECCPKEYYQLMLKCWSHEPNSRPKFSEIVNILPDCRPELLQAIRNSNYSSGKNEFLSYRVGEIVTVIDKSPRGDTIDPAYDSCWKGVSNERKTGYFNPSDFVAYLGQNLPSNACPASSSSTSSSFMQNFLSSSSPSSTGSSNGQHNHNHSGGSGSHNSLASTITSTVLQSSKFIRGFLESRSHHTSTNSSPHGTRKTRLRPEMISKPQEGKYHHLPKNHSASNSLDGSESKSKKLPSISHPIASFARNSSASLSNCKNGNYLGIEENHEYHEISDEDDFGPLESPPFEVLDFGPSLMEEVFRELDHIKPDLNSETAESETAINENGINVKNEVLEMNLKICKEAGNSRKKQSTVKPISEAEQNELESAIAMAKDIASRTMLEDELDLTKNDSPKTPNSPNKRKFSFKFPTHKSSPKGERRTFSEETESIGDIIESITPAAKEAYLSLVEKGVSASCSTAAKKEHLDKRPEVKPPPPPPLAQPAQTIMPIASFNANLPGTSSCLANGMNDDNNPLRMLRTAGIGKVLRPKVRGNRSFSQPRLPTTAQTAGLARVASSRSQLGSPPPVPSLEDHGLQLVQSHTASGAAIAAVNNALPLPPRDRTRPLIQLKTHQRRHPLVIPAELTGTAEPSNCYSAAVAPSDDLTFDSVKHESPPLVHRHVPVLKQVSCPQAPAAFLNVYNRAPTNSTANALPPSSSLSSAECDTASAPVPPLHKPNRTYLTDDLTESLESEMQKAFDSIKLGQDTEPDLEAEASETIPIAHSEAPATGSQVKAAADLLVDRSPIQFDTSNGHSTSSLAIVNSTDYIENKKAPLPAQTNGATMSQSTKSTVDRDEVRVMQKVLGNEANLSDEECAQILDTTDWDIHKAIKCVRLRQQLRSHNIEVDCDWAQMLIKFNWNIRHASNYLIATRGVPEDTTEV